MAFAFGSLLPPAGEARPEGAALPARCAPSFAKATDGEQFGGGATEFATFGINDDGYVATARRLWGL